MPTVVLSISKEFNNWLIASGGSERGDRQRFILGTLKMFKNGFIVKDGSVQKITSTDIRQNIDVLRAEADAKARSGNTTNAAGDTCVFFTPVDILDEIKNLPRFKQMSQENRDTLKAMREEQVKISSVIPSPEPTISPYNAPPPPLPKKDD